MWGEFAATALAKGGWTRSRAVAGLFWHPDLSAMCELHGDDFLYVAPLRNHGIIDGHLRQHTEVKILAKVGPAFLGQAARFLKRAVRYEVDGGARFELEGNVKNVRDFLAAVSLDGPAPRHVDVPGTKDTGGHLREGASLLEGRDAENFLSIGGALT